MKLMKVKMSMAVEMAQTVPDDTPVGPIPLSDEGKAEMLKENLGPLVDAGHSVTDFDVSIDVVEI